MKKITLATFKKFLKDNENNLYIKNISDFDGMIDMVKENKEAEFKKLEKTDFSPNTLGYKGIWLVGNSRDSFRKTDNGINVYNCCGEFEIITK